MKQPGHKVIITGGAGFMGGHLVDACIARGYSVTVVDNLSVGRRANFSHHEKSPLFRFLQASVEETEKLKACFKGADWVFHFAARTDPLASLENPLAFHRSNVEGTLSVLEVARQAGVKRFIYAASSSCYGNSKSKAFTEKSKLNPLHPCALTKQMGEAYVLQWCRTYGVPAVSLRYFNVYGPRVGANGADIRAFAVFLSQQLHGKPLTVMGDGEQTRDFIYISDAITATLMAAESAVVGEVFNVASGRAHSINQLVQLMGAKEVVHLPARPGNPQHSLGDIRKIQKSLGWEPEVSLAEGVQRVLKRIEDWRDAPVWTSESVERATAQWSEDWFQ